MKHRFTLILEAQPSPIEPAIRLRQAMHSPENRTETETAGGKTETPPHQTLRKTRKKTR